MTFVGEVLSPAMLRKISGTAQREIGSRRVVDDPVVTQLDGLSPYTANLCPLCLGFDLAGFREDFGEAIGELVEAMLRIAVRQRTTEHLDRMLSE